MCWTWANPVKIMDLAKQLIRFYGYEPGVNMDIKIVGLRPGEKLYEELMMDEEQDKMRRTQHNKIFVAPPRSIDLGPVLRPAAGAGSRGRAQRRGRGETAGQDDPHLYPDAGKPQAVKMLTTRALGPLLSIK